MTPEMTKEKALEKYPFLGKLEKRECIELLEAIIGITVKGEKSFISALFGMTT
jgi:hypothetical protein